MDIIQFIAQFFYRIRYWLLWGGFIVTALVAYFTQFLPFSYTVNSNIYAGVTNVTNIDGSKVENISTDCFPPLRYGEEKNTPAINLQSYRAEYPERYRKKYFRMYA